MFLMLLGVSVLYNDYGINGSRVNDRLWYRYTGLGIVDIIQQ